MFMLSESFVSPLCSATSLINYSIYLNHWIAYDDVAQTSHNNAPTCNWLRCKKAYRLTRVLIR